MRPNLSFHLFVSTAPCGDGRVFAFSSEVCAHIYFFICGNFAGGIIRVEEGVCEIVIWVRIRAPLKELRC